jgi:hypothetical protein
MASTKANLKLTQVQGVTVVSENGSTPAAQTIDISADLKKSSETVSTPLVNISALYWTLGSGATATVTRNSVLLHTMHMSGKLEFYGFADIREQASDIVVSVTGGAGTVIVQTSKVSGYGSQQHQNQGDLG